MIIAYNNLVDTFHRGVAQFGRALRSGRRGRKFESCRLDSVFMRVCKFASSFFVSFKYFIRPLKVKFIKLLAVYLYANEYN